MGAGGRASPLGANRAGRGRRPRRPQGRSIPRRRLRRREAGRERPGGSLTPPCRFNRVISASKTKPARSSTANPLLPPTSKRALIDAAGGRGRVVIALRDDDAVLLDL